MFLSKIQLLHFKNHSSFEQTFSEKFVVFCGNNGTGKTAILDAIHYLCLCKSCFNSVDSQQIKYNEEFFMVQGNTIKQNQEFEITCGLKLNHKKSFKVNKKEYSKLAEHIGKFPLVMIAPNDVVLILDKSEERRRFLDSSIAQEDDRYVEYLLKYNSILDNRNALLKRMSQTHSYDQSLFEIYDEALIHLGENIFKKRSDFVKDFVAVFSRYYQRISGGNEQVSLTYYSQLQEDNLTDLLQKNKEKDLILQRTSVGIHKDDLHFLIDGHAIKKVGSQGQQKSFVLALKLAQFEIIRQHKGFAPFLLLDDIFDKLDEQRIAQLLNIVKEPQYGQIFISDTDQKRIEKLFSKFDIAFNLFKLEK